jgi:hypothetical protein
MVEQASAHSFAQSYCTHLHRAIAQPFYNFTKSFFIATLLSHFSLLIAQSFFIDVVLRHCAQPFSEHGHSCVK